MSKLVFVDALEVRNTPVTTRLLGGIFQRDRAADSLSRHSTQVLDRARRLAHAAGVVSDLARSGDERGARY